MSVADLPEVRDGVFEGAVDVDQSWLVDGERCQSGYYPDQPKQPISMKLTVVAEDGRLRGTFDQHRWSFEAVSEQAASDDQ